MAARRYSRSATTNRGVIPPVEREQGIHRLYGSCRRPRFATAISVQETPCVAREPAPFSDEFARTARDEATRPSSTGAGGALARVTNWLQRAGDLLREARPLGSARARARRATGRATQLRLDLQTRHLQGQRLREEARAHSARASRPAHCHPLPRVVRPSRGGGLNRRRQGSSGDIFDAQITRSPVVVRVTDGRGVYELEPHVSHERARARLHEVLAAQAAADDRSGTEAARRPSGTRDAYSTRCWRRKG